MDQYEVAILGCGPAGLTAAIFTARANLKTIVIGLPDRSQAKLAMHIENYFGFPEGVDGPVLLEKGMAHAQKFGAVILKDEAVAATLVREGEKHAFVVKTAKGSAVHAMALIIATGIPIRSSGIANEDKLVGRGLHYCVSCDGPLYTNKPIAIIGNGDHAAEDAVEALSYTKDITIIANAPAFAFSETYQQEVQKWGIKTLAGKVAAFQGEKWFEAVQMTDGSSLPFKGVFMACGAAGALDFAANLGLQLKDNILVVDENNMTSMEGVFAAGNCAGRCREVAKNVGDGCNAAVNVIKFLRSRELYLDYAKGGHALAVVPPEGPAPLPAKKVRVGWFSFSCCEDSTIVFTEILNDYWDRWKDSIEIPYARALRSQNDMTNLDIAFVEGAIASERAAREVKEIRKNARILIAVGACAVTGMPSAQRNQFDEPKQREILPILRAFDYSKKVQPVHEVVPVDDQVPGCPMTEAGFLAVLRKHLAEAGIHAQF
ncbi:MAG: FAD-dependent oxidoreductase [Candidatus Aenigmarchaeota archaeon]|nr:FAD-dependent oxidoreductase [Candidatus Aenigmarchaeota archaeon]